jgi:TolB-like protein
MCAAVAAPLGAQQKPKPNDATQAKLAREQAANPQNVAANRALGVWYYRAGRFSEARVPLETARRLDPKDGVSALYAGLAAEQLKDWGAAKVAYSSYLAVGKTRRVLNDVRARLVSVSKEEVRVAAKAAVANEAVIAQRPGSDSTVAVMPFTFNGTDQTLAPLSRGLADLMITDLTKKRGITVLERDRMQAIADEIALGQTARADQATAVRAGRLIQAGRIVQGGITQTGGSTVTLSSSLINVRTSAPEGRDGQAAGVLDRIFDLEKTLVYSTFTAMNIALTPSERQEIDRRPTNSLQALLSYSRGLEAEDAGRFDEAARFFESARSADPGFGAALQRAQSAAAAQSSSTAKVESNIRSSSEGQAATQSANVASVGIAATLNNVVGDVNPTTTNAATAGTGSGASGGAPPTQRDPASEKTGTDQPAPRSGQVTVVIKRTP